MNIIGLYVCVWLIGEFSTSDVSVLCFIIWKVLILLFKKKIWWNNFWPAKELQR